MDRLSAVLKKKMRRVIGLMSGTSADGIDAVLAEVRGKGAETRIRLVAFQTYPYPAGYKEFLMRNSSPATARLDDVTRLNMLIAEFFAGAAKRIARKADVALDGIDLLGSHGQTVQHLPAGRRMFGRTVRSTLQLGSPSALAKLTGIVTVGDFRTGDVAVGGSGAPLVPYFDYLLFRSGSKARGLLNIGGIANLTVLPKRCSLSDVLAFDTGPGNMVIDALMMKYYGMRFDDRGAVAESGRLMPELLRAMARHSYLRQRPPKSTGRETYGEPFVRSILRQARGAPRRDVIATVTEYTAFCVFWHYLRYVRSHTRIDELLVSGGGVRNEALLKALRRYFGGIPVLLTDERGIPAGAKEALCFAVLANEAIAGNPANVPGATGARRPTVLGTICLP